MKFIVSSSYLLKELQMLGGLISNNNTQAILNNFLFDLNGDTLKVSASDLETTVTTSIAVNSDDSGSIAVPARLLLDILKTFVEQPLTFTVGENNLAEISSNQGKYSLAYVSSLEFPEAVQLSEPSTTTISSKILASAISKTIFAAGNDDLRPVMNGVFFDFTTENLTFVATDAHKLVMYKRNDIGASESVGFIVPKKPLSLLRNFLLESKSNVLIEYNDKNAKFTFDKTELICRLIEGKYPNYGNVIPRENPNKLVINRNQFLNSLRRAGIFSNKTTFQVRLKLAGASLQIYAEDMDYSNKADEQLSCDYQGDDMEIGFNSKFLVEMLANLESDEISLGMSLPERAGLLAPKDGLDVGEEIAMVVMPVMTGG